MIRAIQVGGTSVELTECAGRVLAFLMFAEIVNRGNVGQEKMEAMANRLAVKERLFSVRAPISSPLPCCSRMLICTCKGLDACDHDIGTFLLMGK